LFYIGWFILNASGGYLVFTQTMLIGQLGRGQKIIAELVRLQEVLVISILRKGIIYLFFLSSHLFLISTFLWHLVLIFSLGIDMN
jgi:hypothetical protein